MPNAPYDQDQLDEVFAPAGEVAQDSPVEAPSEPVEARVPEDEAPRTGGIRRGPRWASGGSTAKDEGYKPPSLTAPQIKVKLRQLINTAGGLVTLANPYDGQVILTHADAAAEAYTELAKRHKSVRRAIEALEAGGVYGTCISVTLAMALPILANHNKLPPPLAPIGHLFGAEVASQNGNGNPTGEAA